MNKKYRIYCPNGCGWTHTGNDPHEWNSVVMCPKCWIEASYQAYKIIDISDEDKTWDQKTLERLVEEGDETRKALDKSLKMLQSWNDKSSEYKLAYLKSLANQALQLYQSQGGGPPETDEVSDLLNMILKS